MECFWGPFLRNFEEEKTGGNLGYFWELFRPFRSNCELFRVLMSYFENSTEILCYFLFYFRKSPKFGRGFKIWEPSLSTALVPGHNCWG